jgi:hypothetical protein
MKINLLFSCILFFSISEIFCATDTIPPIITFTGPPFMNIVLNSPFTDPGAIATDNVDGSTTVISTASSSNPDVNLTGTYTITYSSSDLAGNTTSAIRTIVVYNEAEFFNCNNYDGFDTCTGSGVALFSSSITASSILNNHILIQNFGAFGNSIIIDGLVGGYYVGSPISCTNQSLGSGATLVSGHGTITNLNPFSFNYSYVWTDGFSQDNCNDYYISHCLNFIQENSFDLGINIFPNPTSGIFHIIAISKHSLNYYIYNLQGQVVLFKQVNSNDDTIDLTNQPDGIYFIRFVFKDCNLTKKVIVER